MNIPDQKPMWDKKHTEGQHDWFADEPSTLAFKASKIISEGQRVLEIGCGNGRDARFFARKGFNVTATDFSEVAVQSNRMTNKSARLEFRVLDIRDPLPFPDGSFDMVFSALALHYFPDIQTRAIFREIYRVLAPDGVLVFSCKSYDGKRMDNAEQVEKNFYVDKVQRVLHAFDQDYVHTITKELFAIDSLEDREEFYSTRISQEVQCIARKI